MPTGSLSARLDATLLERLRRASIREQLSLSQLVERFLEEAMRVEEWPGIVFRSGPVGRRAGVVGGPDVWEIARDLDAAAAAGSADPIGTVVASTDLSEDQVRLAAGYRVDYPDEIEARVAADAALTARLRVGVA